MKCSQILKKLHKSKWGQKRKSTELIFAIVMYTMKPVQLVSMPRTKKNADSRPKPIFYFPMKRWTNLDNQFYVLAMITQNRL